MRQFPAAKQQQHDDTHADAGIGEIEHGAEEHEVAAADQRHPFGPRSDDDREVEHVNHLTHEERGVARAEGHEIRHVIGRRGVEDKAVEHAVNQIAGGPGQYKRETRQPKRARPEPHLPAEIPAQPPYCRHAEQAEHDLIDERQAEGHAVVLDEADVKPVSHPYAFMQVHPSFNLNLYHLVNDQQQQDNQTDCQPFSPDNIRISHLTLSGIL